MTGRPAVAAVVLAAGAGTRVGAGRNKAYLSLAGRTIVARSLATMAGVPGVRRVLLVTRPGDEELAGRVVGDELGGLTVERVTGGAARHGSEDRALAHLAPAIEAGEIDVVLLHDAARPLCSPELAATVAEVAARNGGGAVPGVPAGDLVAVESDGGIRPLAGLHVRVQTPQGFAAGPLLAAYRAAREVGFEGTDTSACVERFTDLRVRYVPGEPTNLKITHTADLHVAALLLRGGIPVR